GVERTIHIEPSDTAARLAVHLRERPCHQHTAVRLQTYPEDWTINATARVKGRIHGRIGPQLDDAEGGQAEPAAHDDPPIAARDKAVHTRVKVGDLVEAGIGRSVGVQSSHAVEKDSIDAGEWSADNRLVVRRGGDG